MKQEVGLVLLEFIEFSLADYGFVTYDFWI